MSPRADIGRVFARHVSASAVPAVSSSVTLGEFAIARQVFAGTLNWHAHSPSDDMMVVFVVSGSVEVDGTVLTPGGSYWTRPDRERRIRWADGGQALVLYVPASALPESVWEVHRTTLRQQPTMISQGIFAFAKALLDSRTTDNGRLTEYLVKQLLSDSVAALMLEAQDLAAFSAAIERTPYEAAMMYLRMHSTTRNLTVDNVAAALNISGRSLQRALSDRGTTLTASLRQIRTEHALQLLSGNDTAMTMARVAEVTGFANPASLRQALREHREARDGKPTAPPTPTSADFSSTGTITPITASPEAPWIRPAPRGLRRGCAELLADSARSRQRRSRRRRGPSPARRRCYRRPRAVAA